MTFSEIERRPMVLRPTRPPMPDFDAAPPRSRPQAETAPQPPAPDGQVHLLIRYAADFNQADEVVAALTTRPQAEELLRVYEELSPAPSGYDIRSVEVHASAAAALGLR